MLRVKFVLKEKREGGSRTGKKLWREMFTWHPRTCFKSLVLIRGGEMNLDPLQPSLPIFITIHRVGSMDNSPLSVTRKLKQSHYIPHWK